LWTKTRNEIFERANGHRSEKLIGGGSEQP